MKLSLALFLMTAVATVDGRRPSTCTPVAVFCASGCTKCFTHPSGYSCDECEDFVPSCVVGHFVGLVHDEWYDCEEGEDLCPEDPDCLCTFGCDEDDPDEISCDCPPDGDCPSEAVSPYTLVKEKCNKNRCWCDYQKP